MRKLYQFTEDQITEIKGDLYRESEIRIGNRVYPLEEVKEPLKRGDKVKFRAMNSSVFSFGFYYDDNGDNKALVRFVGDNTDLVTTRVICEDCEAYEWTEDELKKLAMGE